MLTSYFIDIMSMVCPITNSDKRLSRSDILDLNWLPARRKLLVNNGGILVASVKTACHPSDVHVLALFILSFIHM